MSKEVAKTAEETSKVFETFATKMGQLIAWAGDNGISPQAINGVMSFYTWQMNCMQYELMQKAIQSQLKQAPDIPGTKEEEPEIPGVH